MRAFRQSLYDSFVRARDALFELLDALLLSAPLTSFPELSLQPVFRRRWPSLYAALDDGRLDDNRLLRLLVAHLPAREPPLLVGDHTAWARPYAYTLADRGLQHQPSPIAGQRPITLGYGFSTLGLIPGESGSWFLPLLHERIASHQTPREKAVEQLARLLPLLTARPLALLDSEYGSGRFFGQAAPLAVDLLVRLRPNRTLYRPAPPYQGFGRPRKHGAVLRFKDATTWGEPDESFDEEQTRLGPVRVQCWRGLHFYDAPECPVDLLRVERLAPTASKREAKVAWLAYRAAAPLPLPDLWQQYLRRYVIEHWYRFIKGKLNWEKPALSTARQAELWSQLLVLASWQLYLARGVAEDQPRPWQKALKEQTPGRVQQGFGGVLAAIGTPAKAPKPRGKSPGWEKGRVRARRVRYAVVKKQGQKPPARAPDAG